MSVSGLKVLADTIATVNGEGAPIYQTSYQLSQPAPNGHRSGIVETVVGNITESIFNLTIQERVAEKADAESAGEEEIVAADVFGGRI